VIAQFVKHYTKTRRHSALGYITPVAAINGKQAAIFKARTAQIKPAQSQRRTRSQVQQAPSYIDAILVNKVQREPDAAGLDRSECAQPFSLSSAEPKSRFH
jgi:hypothetical protein